jgi:hypothetical protein
VRRQKKPGGVERSKPPGSITRWATGLDHAQHDCADKGESDIGGNDAQSADDGHGTPPLFTPLPGNRQSNNSFLDEKSASLTIAVFPHPEPWLKLREINALNIG